MELQGLRLGMCKIESWILVEMSDAPVSNLFFSKPSECTGCQTGGLGGVQVERGLYIVPTPH